MSCTACQAVAECFAKSGKACEEVPASEMLKALEYLIVPQSMWPVGVRYAAALRNQLDGIADRIMRHVKADFEAPPREYSSKSEVKQYWIRKPLQVSGPTAPCQQEAFHCCSTRGLENIIFCPLISAAPAPLQERLIAQAKSSFLKLRFNSMVEQSRIHPCAFEVSVAIR